VDEEERWDFHGEIARKVREGRGAGVGQVKAAAMANRLICYPGSGSVDGDLGDHVLLAPPYIISEEQAGEIVERLARSIEAVLGR
jgi:hypothetical protein